MCFPLYFKFIARYKSEETSEGMKQKQFTLIYNENNVLFLVVIGIKIDSPAT